MVSIVNGEICLCVKPNCLGCSHKNYHLLIVFQTPQLQSASMPQMSRGAARSRSRERERVRCGAPALPAMKLVRMKIRITIELHVIHVMLHYTVYTRLLDLSHLK